MRSQCLNCKETHSVFFWLLWLFQFVLLHVIAPRHGIEKHLIPAFFSLYFFKPYYFVLFCSFTEALKTIQSSTTFENLKIID